MTEIDRNALHFFSKGDSYTYDFEKNQDGSYDTEEDYTADEEQLLNTAAKAFGYEVSFEALSAEQQSTIKNAIKNVDTQTPGTLDDVELENLEDKGAIFQTKDLNKDGEIDDLENAFDGDYTDLYLAAKGEASDLNNDGVIDNTEIQSFLDTDDDGSVSRAEIEEYGFTVKDGITKTGTT